MRPDFVLVVGDDHTDEAAFVELTEWQLAHKTMAPSDYARSPLLGRDCYPCTVGRKPSRAPFFVDDQHAVAGLLDALKWASLRATKSASVEAGLSNLGGGTGGGGTMNGANGGGHGGGTALPGSHGGGADAGLARLHGRPMAYPAAAGMQAPPPGLPPMAMHPPPPSAFGAAAPTAQHAAAPITLDAAALASSGCPFIQAPEQAANAESLEVEAEEPRSGATAVALVAIAVLLALRGTLRLRVKKRVLVLLTAAAFAFPKVRHTLLRLADRLVMFA